MMELTKQDIHNLLVFLDRVNLTGGEAMTFVMLCQKLKAIESNVKDGDDKNG